MRDEWSDHRREREGFRRRRCARTSGWEDRGAHVALVARRHERLAQLAREIADAGGEASVHVCDVSERSAVETACRDIVVLEQDVAPVSGAVDQQIDPAPSSDDVEDIERMMRTNYLGAVYWIKGVLPLMRARGAGWIVEISSLAGVTPQPDEAAYSATKYALTGLSEALAYELAPLGIHVLVVHPALVRTEMFTPEVLARLPKSAAGSFIDPDVFVSATLRALARDEISVIIPRRFRAVTLLRAISPGFIGRALARIKLAALPDRGHSH